MDPLRRLSALGVSIWLDDLSRERLASGNLAELIRNRHVVGVTTNPTIFAAALAHGDAYKDQLATLAGQGVDTDTAVRELTTSDVRTACDQLRDTYERTGHIDGRVSIEVDPELADDPDRTVTEALELWAAVDRPNLMVKIPATAAGLPAITRTLAEGVSVNVTLIFSVQRYREVMAATIAGLGAARDNGHSLATIQSVASFFVSRVDTAVDARLAAIGSPAAMGLLGSAGIANALCAFAAYEEVFAGPDWLRLAKDGATPQRPLWASTGTKDPAYRDTRYVDRLVVAGVVNTMPGATLEAVADHGVIDGDTVTGRAEQGRETLELINGVGVDIEGVHAELEREGVEKFRTSWRQVRAVVGELLHA